MAKSAAGSGHITILTRPPCRLPPGMNDGRKLLVIAGKKTTAVSEPLLDRSYCPERGFLARVPRPTNSL